MNKYIKYLIIGSIASFNAIAQEVEDEEEELTTNVVVRSESVLKKRWERHVVFEDENGDITDGMGSLISKNYTREIDSIVKDFNEDLDAMNLDMNNVSNSLDTLRTIIPSNSLGLAMEMTPVSSADNLMGYIVPGTEWTDMTNDYGYCWFSRSITNRPTCFMSYVTEFGTNNASIVWDTWTPDGISTNGWSGCHAYHVERPTIAVGVRCLTMGNVTMGGSRGFSFGSSSVTVNNLTPFTGILTNQTEDTWFHFDNGFLMGMYPVDHWINLTSPTYGDMLVNVQYDKIVYMLNSTGSSTNYEFQVSYSDTNNVDISILSVGLNFDIRYYGTFDEDTGEWNYDYNSVEIVDGRTSTTNYLYLTDKYIDGTSRIYNLVYPSGNTINLSE